VGVSERRRSCDRHRVGDCGVGGKCRGGRQGRCGRDGGRQGDSRRGRRGDGRGRRGSGTSGVVAHLQFVVIRPTRPLEDSHLRLSLAPPALVHKARRAVCKIGTIWTKAGVAVDPKGTVVGSIEEVAFGVSCTPTTAVSLGAVLTVCKVVTGLTARVELEVFTRGSRKGNVLALTSGLAPPTRFTW